MGNPANLYAAENCKVPIFKWDDKRWHVDYVKDGKWTERKFVDPETAYGFYNHIFKKLEEEYNQQNNCKAR